MREILFGGKRFDNDELVIRERKRGNFSQYKRDSDGFTGSFNDYGRLKGHGEVEDDYSEESFPGNKKTKWYEPLDLGLRKDMDGEVRIIRPAKEKE